MSYPIVKHGNDIRELFRRIGLTDARLEAAGAHALYCTDPDAHEPGACTTNHDGDAHAIGCNRFDDHLSVPECCVRGVSVSSRGDCRPMLS